MEMHTLFSVASLLKCTVDQDRPISGFEVDSRYVKSGTLFFALSGKKTDGHLFLKQAKDLGAAAAVVSEEFNGESAGLPLLRVKDTLKALHELARAVFAKKKCQVIAV